MQIPVEKLSTIYVDRQMEKADPVDCCGEAVDNVNSHIHIDFKGVQIGICGIKRVLSTSFPQFVDKVMLIWIMWIEKSTDVDDPYLVFKLEKEKLYLVLWKITIFLPYFQGNYIFEN